jgi:DNA-binding MarR family transcriptional regulator
MGELAAALILDRSALAHNIKPLERDGFVVLAADAQDQRVRRVSLTEAGVAKLAETTRLWEAAQSRFERAFGVEEARSLRAALSVIASDDFVEAFERSPL